MRISDWSSDVCSSDLSTFAQRFACLVEGFGQIIPYGFAARADIRGRYHARNNRKPLAGLIDQRIRIGADLPRVRSEERRVGNEWVRPGRSRGTPYHKTKTLQRINNYTLQPKNP